MKDNIFRRIALFILLFVGVTANAQIRLINYQLNLIHYQHSYGFIAENIKKEGSITFTFEIVKKDGLYAVGSYRLAKIWSSNSKAIFLKGEFMQHTPVKGETYLYLDLITSIQGEGYKIKNGNFTQLGHGARIPIITSLKIARSTGVVAIEAPAKDLNKWLNITGGNSEKINTDYYKVEQFGFF